MSNKLDIDSAIKLIEGVNKNAEALISEKEKMRRAFENLGSSFKDMDYQEYESQIDSIEKSMSTIISDLANVASVLNAYVKSFNN